jgi:hypothetical protein
VGINNLTDSKQSGGYFKINKVNIHKKTISATTFIEAEVEVEEKGKEGK